MDNISLMTDSIKLKLFMEGLETVKRSLSWDERNVVFDSRDITNLIKVMFPATYQRMVEELKMEKEKKNED